MFCDLDIYTELVLLLFMLNILAHNFPQSLKREAVLQLFDGEAQLLGENWLPILLLLNNRTECDESQKKCVPKKMTQIGNNNETLPYCHQQSRPVDKYMYISHTWSGQEIVPHAVSDHRVLLLYYRVLGNINSCLFMVMCGCETSAILRDWKLKPWLPQGR